MTRVPSIHGPAPDLCIRCATNPPAWVDGHYCTPCLNEIGTNQAALDHDWDDYLDNRKDRA